jgi:hypothetical protein
MSIDQGTVPRYKSLDISIFQKHCAKSSLLNAFENCETTEDERATLMHKSVLFLIRLLFLTLALFKYSRIGRVDSMFQKMETFH